jgi:hypothetical protein
MTLISREQLLAPVPLKTETLQLENGLEVRLKEMAFSEVGKLSAWLFPEGEVDKQRQETYRLRQAVLCIVDADDKPVFDFPDTEKGNEQFFEFADTVGKGGAGHWALIIDAVRRLHNEGEADDLEKKS